MNDSVSNSSTSVLQKVFEELNRYVRLTPDEATATATWIVFTHLHDVFTHSPLLAIQSPLPGCGKSTLGNFIGALVPKPIVSSNLTRAVLYRVKTNNEMPTLLLDEADTYAFHNPEMVGILNAGHAKHTAKVHRTSGDKFEVTAFDAWMPKVLMFIGNSPKTLVDRSIPIRLKRLLISETVERMPSDPKEFYQSLRSEVAEWASANREKVRTSNPQIPSELQNRARDNWLPMLSIGSAVGGGWQDRITAAAIALSGGISKTLGEQLLVDIRRIFSNLEMNSVSTKDLLRYLCEIEDSPWDTINEGYALDPMKLASLLEPFGIGPQKMHRSGSQLNVRGYRRSSFAEVFARYLPPEGPDGSDEPDQSEAA